jgi:hypothetical protein
MRPQPVDKCCGESCWEHHGTIIMCRVRVDAVRSSQVEIRAYPFTLFVLLAGVSASTVYTVEDGALLARSR